jgi:hypothetical protein
MFIPLIFETEGLLVKDEGLRENFLHFHALPSFHDGKVNGKCPLLRGVLNHGKTTDQGRR